jgi:hypothetical protein
MQPAPITAALLAALLVAPLMPAPAEAGSPSECRRFVSEETRPNDFAPRLNRLCVKLIEAHTSPRGLSEVETEAATRLGTYLAIVGEIDLRRGAAGIGMGASAGKPATQTARYLIAREIGLLDMADRLAPVPLTAELR